jgi:hypothetical protein
LLKTGQKILVFPIFDDFGEKKNVTQVGGLITHPFWPGVYSNFQQSIFIKKNKTGKNYVSKSPDFLHICN